MSRLLDDLLDVARITRGHVTLRTEPIDLRETAQGAIEALGPFLAEHDTQLTVDISPEPLPVIGDTVRLQQIQANLLSNASKYSPSGSPVRFELRRVGREAMIRVTDHGRGIDPEMLPRIFDLFVQGQQTLARPEGGLGVGLTLLQVARRAPQRAGRGRRATGENRGSVFTVWLPLAPDGSACTAEASRSVMRSTASARWSSSRIRTMPAGCCRSCSRLKACACSRRPMDWKASSASSGHDPISHWSIWACRS